MGTSVREENAIQAIIDGTLGTIPTHTHANMAVLNTITSDMLGNIPTDSQLLLIDSVPTLATIAALNSHISDVIHHSHSNKTLLDNITATDRTAIITNDEAAHIISDDDVFDGIHNLDISATNLVADMNYVDTELALKVDQIDFDDHINQIGVTLGVTEIHHIHNNHDVLELITYTDRTSIISDDEASRILPQDFYDSIVNNVLLSSTNIVMDTDTYEPLITTLQTDKLDIATYDAHIIDVGNIGIDHIHHVHDTAQINLLENIGRGTTVDGKYQYFGDILFEEGHKTVNYNATASYNIIHSGIEIIFPQGFTDIPGFNMSIESSTLTLGMISYGIEEITKDHVVLTFKNMWKSEIPGGSMVLHWTAWGIKP